MLPPFFSLLIVIYFHTLLFLYISTASAPSQVEMSTDNPYAIQLAELGEFSGCSISLRRTGPHLCLDQ
jgi:hypothetical protein